MKKNKISVTSDNIFPIIKKFLYSDQEVFLRELISNATDAILKLKTISRLKNLEKLSNNFEIQVLLNKKNGSIHIIDNGIGMSKIEIEKYINQIAFSGAEEFIQKYKKDSSSIIGHFGLGFYSSFMVSNKVTILTQSYKKDEESMFWSCDGSTDFIMKKIDKRDRGTEIILIIDKKNQEFLEYDYVLKLLQRYCKFMPVPIYLSLDSNYKRFLINNIYPAWKKNPNQLKDADYLKFHKELYPNQLDQPLFWVHLNIDHPFNLNGILYFPKIENKIDLQREKIHLYQNQVYITDDLQGIVPEFLSLLRGIIDSPNIPLNVSRSHLQSDKSVKNISQYITRKVSDKLNFLFKNNRLDFQKKWNHIKIIVEYGMISDEKFFKNSINFFLFTTVDNNFFTLDEFKNKVNKNQRNKDGKIIFLYASNKKTQFSSIKESKNKSYEVLFFDSPLSVHLIQKLELAYQEINFIRVDADHIDKLIFKGDKKKLIPELSEQDKNRIKNYIDNQIIGEHKFYSKLENLSEKDQPFLIIVPEFLRRMKEMNSLSNNFSHLGDEENKHQIIVNINNSLIKKILRIVSEKKRKEVIQDALSLTLLSKNLLNGKDLDNFISKKIEELSNLIYSNV